ncbi:MAG TPA: hypothetical protein VFT37_02010 [Telluria sp.]|nr:hypothetical protein [Telluria sp.]
MAITLGSSVTLDESDGLQNAVATPSPAGDANDNDTANALPAAFSAKLTGAGTYLDAALSGYNGSNTGTNAFSFNISGATGMGFTDSSGAPLNDDVSNLFTTDGREIKLYTDSSDNNVLYGMVDGAPGTGTVAFAAYLQETGTPLSGAKLWTVQYLAIEDPTADPDEPLDLTNKVYVSIDQAVHFSFANAPSGQNLFLMLGNATTGFVITGMNAANQSEGESITTGDTVNTSKGGGATTVGNTNQMVDPVEGVYITYVSNPNSNYTIPNLSQGEADIEANIAFGSTKLTNGGGIDIVQLQKAKMATVQLTAINTDATSADFIDDDVTNTPVVIDSVVVKQNGVIIESLGTGSDVDSANIDIDLSLAGVATITGVKAGMTIEYHSPTPHNRLLVENIPAGNANASFDIGGVSMLDTAQTTDEIGSLMRFEDAGPSISQNAPVDTADVNTQDADTKGTNTDSDTQSFASAFSVTSNYDADGAGTTTWAYAFSLPTPGADSGLKSSGAAIYLYLDSATGKVLASTSSTQIGVTTANTIFDLAVSATGVVTMQQFAQIDHALPGVGTNFSAQQRVLANGLINLDATATITDADGDSASATRSLDLGGNLEFDDDGPGTFTPDSVTLVNTGTGTATDDLNSDGTEGADIPGTVKFVDDDPTDALLRDTNGNVLQSGGENITLSGFGTGTLTATRVTTGDTVFVATLDNSSADDYTITFSRAIDDGSGFVDFLGAAPVKSGNPTYNILPDVGDTSIDILFSGGDTAGGLPSVHSVNVSTTGAGTDNQSMNATGGKGDLLRMDFATGASLAGSPSGSDFNLGTHTTINGFSFLLSQNTPSGTTGTMYIRAYDADADKTLVGDGGDLVDPITKVTVNGVVVFENGTSTNATINGKTVTAIAYNDGVVLTGLSEGQTGDGTGGDDPVIKVSTADGFNRVEVSNYSGQTLTAGGTALAGGDFDIAPAGFEIPQAGDPFSFNLPVRNYDFDEDFSPIALIGVNITPEPLP